MSSRRGHPGGPAGPLRPPAGALRRAGWILGLLAAVGLAAIAASCGAPERPRHLVLVSVDTLRADHVRAYGGPVETPAVDALAAEGVWVDGAYTPVPTTGPAHASLFTGLHPWRHRVVANGVALDEAAPTLAGRLREHGFATTAFVASYVLHPRFGFGRGFEAYELLATHGAVWGDEVHERFYAKGAAVTDRALAWLDGRAGDDGRFFLWLHYFDPHLPYEPPEGFSLGHAHDVNLHGKRVPPGVDGRAHLRQMIRDYRGEVRYVDAEIGRLVAGLRKAGLLHASLVVVTADHGEGLGDHGRLDHGRDLHEEQVRVPLVLRGPGVPARGRLRGLVQLEDLAPTLLSLLGLPALEGVDGLDLAGWLRGERSASPRREVLGRIKDDPEMAELYFHRGPEQKWIGEVDAAGRLYVLGDDPRERDPAPGRGAPAALLEDLADAPVGEAPARALDAEARAALESLGYLDRDDP